MAITLILNTFYPFKYILFIHLFICLVFTFSVSNVNTFFLRYNHGLLNVHGLIFCILATKEKKKKYKVSSSYAEIPGSIRFWWRNQNLRKQPMVGVFEPIILANFLSQYVAIFRTAIFQNISGWFLLTHDLSLVKSWQKWDYF